jgi:signal transduction histidine kinase
MCIRDRLNFSRQQKLIAEETDLNALLENVIGDVSLYESYQGIEISKYFFHDLPQIQCDANQIKQVFINLLNNAAEAIENDGKITVRTSSPDSRRVEIKITDTGCGIPDEFQDQLFTPFFSTKALGKGTGLGLSIVYGIIKMHHGQISIDSQVGEGTTVTVSLPTRQP